MATTSHTEVESLSAELVDTVWNTGDTARLGEFVDVGYVRHDPGYDDPIRGIDGYAELVTDLRTGMPDLEGTIERSFLDEDGETLFVEFVRTGIHGGVFRGIPPTGRAFCPRDASLGRVVDGSVREEWLYYDTAELRRQLGVTFPAILGNLPRFGRYYLGRLNERRGRGSGAR